MIKEILFIRVNSEEEILDMRYEQVEFSGDKITLKEVLQHWWDNLPYGFKLGFNFK